jgi:hypothetical protein
MFKKAIELSNNEVASIKFKAYNTIINFIDERIGINNATDIDAYIKILRNDELTFNVFIDINLSRLVDIDINKNIDRAFQVVEYELSKALEKS